MKKTMGIGLTLVYLFGMLAPFLPYVNYAVQQDYFAEILCINRETPELMCNGQCILMQQLEATAQLAESQAPVTPAELPHLQLDEPAAQWIYDGTGFSPVSLCQQSPLHAEVPLRYAGADLVPPIPPPRG